MKPAIFAAITLLGLSSPLIAGPFEDADAAYDKGDYAMALRLISPLVDQVNTWRRPSRSPSACRLIKCIYALFIPPAIVR
jgi:hypothetical protein